MAAYAEMACIIWNAFYGAACFARPIIRYRNARAIVTSALIVNRLRARCGRCDSRPVPFVSAHSRYFSLKISQYRERVEARARITSDFSLARAEEHSKITTKRIFSTHIFKHMC